MNSFITMLLFAVSSCSQATGADVNKPLASAEIPNARPYDQVRNIVAQFAEQNHFAVQPLISSPQGKVQFSMRLFRDDVSVMITQLQGGPIQVTAYPLCACELHARLGLQSAADETAASLKALLSSGH